MGQKEHLFFELKKEYVKHTPIKENLHDSKFFDGLLNYDQPKLTLYTMTNYCVDVDLKNRHEKGFWGSQYYQGKDFKCFLSRVKNKKARWKLEIQIENVAGAKI